MPIFEIQSPDGKTYEFDAPDQNAAIAAFSQIGGGGQLDQQQTTALDRARALHEARAGGTPLAMPQPHNAPDMTGLPAGDLLSEARTATGGFLEGVPIAGPMIRGGVDRAAAATMAPFSDKTYDEVLDIIQRGTAEEKLANPYIDTGAQIAGGVAGTVPLIAAAPGAFGVGATTKVGQAAGGAMGGSALGGADAFVRSGGDLFDTGRGAVIGGGLGAVGPTVGRLAGKGVSKVADALMTSRLAKATGVDKNVFGMMSRAAADDGLDAATVPQQLADLGPEGMLLDLGTNLKQQAAGLASLPGEGRSIVRNAIAARDMGANQRIMSTLDNELGPAPIPSRINAGIERNQTALSPEYQAAFRDAQPVDTAPIARYLDREITTLRGEAQRGLQRIRTMLNRVMTPEQQAEAAAAGVRGPLLETNPVTLLETRKAIDGMLETTVETNARNALTTARQAVDDELRASVPGIKEVDAKYAELARQRQGLQRGQTILSSGREAPRPAELAQEFQQGALPQGMQIGPSAVPVRLREGARAEIERIIGTNANDRVALQRLIKGEGDWNRDRLATLFGQDRADKVIQLLDRERAFADTSQMVTRNSETAARQAAQRELMGVGGGDFGVVDSFKAGGARGAARAAGVKGVEQIVEALKDIRSDQARTMMAKTLTGNNTAVVDALLEASRGRNIDRSKVDRVARALLLTSASRGRD